MKKLASLAFPLVAALVAGGAMPHAAAPKPKVTASDVTVVEGGIAVVVLTLSEPVSGFVVLEYKTASRSAKGDLDYFEGSGPVIFFPGMTEGVIQVPTIDDSDVEGDEVFTVRLHSSQATTPGGPVRITIVDND